MDIDYNQIQAGMKFANPVPEKPNIADAFTRVRWERLIVPRNVK
jgi:hypothetical protein